LENTLLIAPSSYNALPYKNVYIVDSSLKKFRQNKVSYLLNNEERENITGLISVVEYTDYFNKAKERLLHLAENIYFNLPMINIDNKSNDYAFFIKEIIEKKAIKLNSNFVHLFTSPPELNSTNLLKQKLLDPKKISKKLNGELKISASALDTFGKCPYQYFISYILMPNHNELFSQLEIGSIYHEVIDKVNQLVINKQISFKDAMYNEEILNYLKDEITKTIEKAKAFEKIRISDDRLDRIITRMIHNLIVTFDFLEYMQNNTNYIISSSEKAINVNNILYSNYFDNVKFTGKIDATYTYKNFDFVLDYKTSDHKFEVSKLKNGTSNQLISYMYNLNNLDNHNVIGAFFKEISDDYVEVNNLEDYNLENNSKYTVSGLKGIYVKDMDSFVNFDKEFDFSDKSSFSNISINTNKKDGNYRNKSILSKETIEEYYQYFQNNMKKLLSCVENGDFAILPYEEDNCKYCNYKSICHVTESSLTRKDIEKQEKEKDE
jgi:ATP-dependent helicase/DNAse subunit B